MEKKSPIGLPELIFASTEIRKKVHKWQKEGIIRNIAPRIYTTNFEEDPANIIKRRILEVLGNLYPGAVLSHRSAFEFRPTEANHIFVTYEYTKKIELPGVTIRFLEGHGSIEGDNKFIGELCVSQKERALLENLQASKRPGPESKTLSLLEIEEKLEEIIRVHGEEGLNKTRDRAREIAKQLDMQKEFEQLNKMISSMLTTSPSKRLKSPLAKARALSIPYDKARIQLFEILFRELSNREFKSRPDKNTTPRAFRNFAFFESYFSNYIEGTIFEIEEAREIIETGKPLPARNDDSHDVLGTYQIVSSKKEMSIVPSTPEELIDFLLARHKILLSARTSKNPGGFKDKNNRAGSTHFVDYSLVRGTLIKGFDFYRALREPFAKAAYMMFLISEIHPFLDGNGRIARIMMNAELVVAGESKIIIPTVYRDDYLPALKKLTNKSEPDVYIRMLQRAHEFSENVYAEDMDEMQKYLESCNAFSENDEVKILQIKPRI
ncbi:MAG: Fic family protein [Cytophagaceae bacterium]|nr:Fic family protein [Cytophagaceae bacterium]